MQIRVTHNAGRISSALQDLSWAVSYAAATALTKSAYDATKAIYAEMDTVFDRPTPYAKRSLRVQGATKHNLVAEIRPREFGGGTPVWKYLGPQVSAGRPRQPKRYEVALQARGVLPAGMITAPGRGAKLDAYGNLSRGQIKSMLTWFGASSDAHQNRTAKSTKRRKSSWSVMRRNGRPFAIAQRTSAGIAVVLVFISSASYRPRLDLDRVAQETTNARFPVYFSAALDKLARR